jgi:hypothetical protein
VKRVVFSPLPLLWGLSGAILHQVGPQWLRPRRAGCCRGNRPKTFPARRYHQRVAAPRRGLLPHLKVLRLLPKLSHYLLNAAAKVLLLLYVFLHHYQLHLLHRLLISHTKRLNQQLARCIVSHED